METIDDDLASRPVDADGVSAVALGTGLWALAGGVLFVFFRPQLAEADNTWWLWVCVVGTVLGLLGLSYTTRRRAAYQVASRDTDEEDPRP